MAAVIRPSSLTMSHSLESRLYREPSRQPDRMKGASLVSFVRGRGAGGRDSSASEVISSTPREASSSTSVASSGETRVELDQQVDDDALLVMLVEAKRG